LKEFTELAYLMMGVGLFQLPGWESAITEARPDAPYTEVGLLKWSKSQPRHRGM